MSLCSIETLDCTFVSHCQALEHSQSSRVAYEVVLSVQRLVHKYGKDQQMITWDLILDIIDALLRHIEVHILY